LEGDDSGGIFGSVAVTFSGNGGSDSFGGGFGNDTFYGGIGSDRGNGGEGNDLLFGDLDDDRLNGELGDDTLFGGPGDDILGEQGISGGDNLLFGGQGNDLLSGSLGNDFLSGDTDNDDIEGSQGNDTLIGGIGFDLLTGGFRAITSTGDEVQDVFVVEVNDEFDLVADFEDGIDKLGLPEGVVFEELLITQLGNEAIVLNQQPELGWANESTDIAIKLAATGQVLTVLNANVGDDPTLPLLNAAQITREDFINL
jgi:Ca2+-binding RTX toxin-like protein